jgi:hypothetical protein
MLVSLSSYFELVLNGFDKLFEEVLYLSTFLIILMDYLFQFTLPKAASKTHR